VWGDASTIDDPADWGNDPTFIGPFNYNLNGAFGGGTLGVNWQQSGILLGLETDLGYMDLSGSTTSASSNPIYHQDHSVDGGFYALLGGRIGAVFGNTLVYAKGGWVYFDGEAQQTTTKPGYVTNPISSFDGSAVGGGVEQIIGGGWSVKAEYLHFDFGGKGGDQTSITDPPIGHAYEFFTNVNDVDSVKAGVNYNFGWLAKKIRLALSALKAHGRRVNRWCWPPAEPRPAWR
jgi:outer membrane immunogenic protein